VQNLFSPPRTPRYNASIEAGIGSLTSRTEQAAARRGHPGAWTYGDVVLARREANPTSGPHRIQGPSPEELWSTRTTIPPTERERFGQTVAWTRKRLEQEWHGRADGPELAMEQRTLNREAIRRALVAHGYLHYTRRRIPPRIPKREAAGIM
jgi:hypothetical protein